MLVYTTQVKSAFYLFLLASMEVNSKYNSPRSNRIETKWLDNVLLEIE